MNTKDIFEASRGGEIDALTEHLKTKPDLSLKNSYGFTALHCAAMGSNSVDNVVVMEVLKLLIDAGSPLEIIGTGGRTPLYLLSEFSPSVEPVKLMIAAGANPNVFSDQGIHVVENAMVPEVQFLLSELTGVPIPQKPEPPPPPVKMDAAAWKKAKTDLDLVFKKLSDAGLIVLQDAGATQSDGFNDCSEIFHSRTDKSSIPGFCFYTRQDLNRAKKTSVLPIAIWGAPNGDSAETIKVGNVVVEAFKNTGLLISWTGSSSLRPSVYLHHYSS